MSKDARHLQKQPKGISILKQGLLLRLGLFGHIRAEDSALEFTREIRKLNREIEAVSKKLHRCKPASAEEDNYLLKIRELEDKRFQVLSLLNGGKIQDYGALQPRYRH